MKLYPGTLAALLLLPVLAPVGSADAAAVGLERIELDVKILDAVAWTTATLHLANPANSSLESNIMVPLSVAAVLTNITLTTHNQTYYGVVQEKKAAQVAYNASKAAGRDAVLLRSAGAGRLALSVNIAAETSVILKASYVEPLVLTAGVYDYRLPLSAFQTAYSPIGSLDLTLTVDQSHGWSDLDASGLPFSFTGAGNRHAAADYAASPYEGTEDLSIRIQPSAAGYTSSFLPSERSEDAAVLFNLIPPGFGGQPIPLDIVFVIDHSGSMGGEKILQALAALDEILGQLRPTDRFGLVQFDDIVEVYREDLEFASPAAIEAARAWVAGVRADGSTNLEGGAARALELLSATERAALPTVVLITDGMPTEGITDHAAIIDSLDSKNTVEGRLHTVGIGFDQDNAFLSALAVATRGFYQPILQDASVEETLKDFYQRIATPVLRDITVTVSGLTASDLHPSPVPDLYQGSNLVLAGRADTRNLPASLTVTLSGRDAEGPVTIPITVDTRDIASWAPVDRLWARQKANSIERALEGSGDTPEQASLRAELLDVGIRHQVSTLVTSWVVVTTNVDIDAEPEYPASSLTGAVATGGYAYATATGTGIGTGALDQQSSVMNDEAGEDGAAEKTPGWGAVAVLLAAAVVVILGKRRKDPPTQNL